MPELLKDFVFRLRPARLGRASGLPLCLGFAWGSGVGGLRTLAEIIAQAPEAEIYDDFGKVYRRYRAIKRKEVGEFFFNEMDDIVEKLCDDFEGSLKG